MPRNDNITIRSIEAPRELPENEWKTFLSILYGHKSANEVIRDLILAEIERIKKEESETTPINPLSSKEDLEKTTRQ